MRALFALSLTLPVVAWAGSPDLTAPAADRPSGVLVRQSPGRFLLTDAKGRTLYVLNMRLAMSRTGQTTKFCIGLCAEHWAPFSPSTSAAPIADWTIVTTPFGKQWAYKNALVFEFRADNRPGDVQGDGYQDIFKALAYVPVAPKIVVPPSVQLTYIGRRFILTDQEKRPLVIKVADGRCRPTCLRDPLLAGMAARPIGDWTILKGGDRPQWAYRGQPVFVANMLDNGAPPPTAIALPAI